MLKDFQQAFDDLTNDFRRLSELDDEDFVLPAWRKVEAAGHAFFACLRSHPELWDDCPDYLKREPIWEAKDKHHKREDDLEPPWDLYWYAVLSWMEGREPEALVKLGGASSHCKYPGHWPDWSPVEDYNHFLGLLGQGADDAGFYRIIVEASEAACRYLHRQLGKTESDVNHEPHTNGVPTSSVGGNTEKGECYILGGDAQPAVGDVTPLAGGIMDRADRDQPTLADIPQYDSESSEWVSTKETATIEELRTETLRTYRKHPHCICRAEDGGCGIDRDGRMWRRKPTTPNAHVMYFRPFLKFRKKK